MNACTIVARNYLAFARVVATSFVEQHPGGRFWVLVIDDVDHRVDDASEPFTVLRLDDLDLGDDEVHRMAALYCVTELATAVKPWLLRRLLEEVDAVAYLDPDICVYAAIDDVADLAREHGVVLTPHTVDPIPRDGLRPTEAEILASGVYNLGFVAVGRGSLPMLVWWSERLARDCIIDHSQMLFTDQRWMDLVPGYHSHHILTSRAFNVAYWNLHARPLSWSGDHYEIGSEPLRFFHFSGYRPEVPERLSTHQGDAPRVTLSDYPDLRKICDDYADRLRAAGHAVTSREPYAWDTTPGGHRLDRRSRRVYRAALIDHERGVGPPEPPNPFTSEDAFFDWLRSPADGDHASPPVSRYLMALYADRPDLQAAFPAVPGRDNVRYLRWVLADGVTQVDIPPALVPPTPAATSVRLPRRAAGRVRRALAARAATAGSAAEVTAPDGPAEWPTFARPSELTPGINVAGYFRAELGVGEGGRLVLDTVAAAGVDHSTVTTTRTSSRQHHPFVDRGRPGAPYDVNLVCVNADQVPTFARDVGPAFFDGRYTIGMWHWEVEEFPPVMHAGFDFVDEVWCGSEFTAASVRKNTDKPVFAFPLPIVAPDVPADVTRADLGLPEDRLLFCFAFDYFSFVERKNPLGVIEAFRRAFPPDSGPVLLIKSINGDRRPATLARLRAAAAGRADIIVRDEYLSARHKAALMGLVDCYVSLHRSEGFGLTVAEAMALGKPVIATAYGGTLDFTTEDNAFLVPYEPVPIPPGCDPYPAGARWAAADIEVAAQHMLTVARDPELAAAKGARAREDVLAMHSVNERVAFVRERLADIGTRRAGATLAAEGVRERLGVLSPELADPPLPPERGLHRAIRLVNSVPDIHGPTDKGSLAYLTRRVVRRLTNHQTRHQHEVNMALAVGLHELSDRQELAERWAAGTDERLRELRDELRAVSRRVEDAAISADQQLQALSQRFDEEVPAAVRGELQDTLTNGWSYELGLQMRAHIYSLLVDNGMTRTQTYQALALLQQRAGGGPLAACELRVFSQNGEDGVLAELLRRMGPGTQSFVEFGIESGREGNCVLLADILGWQGLFIEADDDFFDELQAKYAVNEHVTTTKSLVTPENVNDLFRSAAVPAELDVLSIDVDGNDYWIWDALHDDFRPRIVVVEYNASLGVERALVQPESSTPWDGTDFYGASIAAMRRVGARKGYSLVHQELSGNNAFFVRDDQLAALGELGPPPSRAPNYSLNAERHPRDPHGRRYLDLDTGALVERPA